MQCIIRDYSSVSYSQSAPWRWRTPPQRCCHGTCQLIFRPFALINALLPFWFCASSYWCGRRPSSTCRTRMGTRRFMRHCVTTRCPSCGNSKICKTSAKWSLGNPPRTRYRHANYWPRVVAAFSLRARFPKVTGLEGWEIHAHFCFGSFIKRPLHFAHAFIWTDLYWYSNEMTGYSAGRKTGDQTSTQSNFLILIMHILVLCLSL